MARKFTRLLALLSLTTICFGCRESSGTPANVALPTAAPAAAAHFLDSILQVHWLGKKAIAVDTNAAALMKIWNMPESTRLEVQTLNKLSASPWRLLRRQTNPSSTNLLRPLLQDLVDEESYVQIDRATNAANDIVLAIRLNNQRAELWATNLAAALESLTGIRPVRSESAGPKARWSLKKHHSPNLIEFVRAGDWVVIGAAQDHNGLLDETLRRLKRGEAPIEIAGTNKECWLEASADLPRLAEILGAADSRRAGLPRVSFAVRGDSGQVSTRGEFVLPDSRSIRLTPWNIPTNLIDGSLASFTAVRGLGTWLGDSQAWASLHAGPPPDQLCLWAVGTLPMQTYFAAPLPDASNAVSRITDLVLQKGAPWFATNSAVGFKRSQTYNGLLWHGIPYIMPFLLSMETNKTSFMVGGFFHAEKPFQPPQPAMIKEIVSHANLVCYDWELSNYRVNQWIYLGQVLRFLSGKPQLPADSAALDWLKSIGPRLEACITEITLNAPGHLSFARNSTVGFTGIELHVLADWLESPDFPRGLHTFLARPEGQPAPAANRKAH